MDTIKPLLTLFDMDEQGYTPAMRRRRLLGRVILAACLVFFVIYDGYLIAMLVVAWLPDGGSWGDFWRNLFAIVVPTFALPSYILSEDRHPAWSLRDDFRALRRAAVAGDDALAPIVVATPDETGVADGALPPPGPVGALDRLFAQRQLLNWWLAAVFCGFGAVLTVAGPTSSLPELPSFVRPLTTARGWESLFAPAVVVYIGLVGLALMGVCLIALWRAIRYSADLAIETDAHGIRWRPSPWRRACTEKPWSAARAFYMVGYRGGRAWNQRITLALDFGDAILAWETIAISNQYLSAPTAIAREEAIRTTSQRLCTLIMRSTGLPLRNITAGATRIAEMKGDAADSTYDNPIAIGLARYDVISAVDTQLPGFAPPARRLSTAQVAWLAAMLAGCALALIAGVGAIVQFHVR